ncbi:MAG: AMP-binding protein [Deltaproteobacteria bacterium]|nr:AMP-binding protein [Deltaproteobacteria bacterium]
MNYSDKPWLKSYKLGPYKLKASCRPYPVEPLWKVLDNAADTGGGKTALQMGDQTMSYKKLREQADALAFALAGMGIRRGDRVCLFLPNRIEFVVGDWGIIKAGAATVPTSTMRTDEGLLHELSQSGARAVICCEADLPRVLALKAKTAFENVIVVPDTGSEGLKNETPGEGIFEFNQLIRENLGKTVSVDIDPMNDLCELSFTGGATGLPKGVMITHFNRYANLLHGLGWMMEPLSRGIIGKSSVFITIPLFHSYGHALIHMAAYWSLRVLIAPDPRDIENIVNTIREHRPFLIPTIPTQLMRIGKYKIGRVNCLFFSGSAPLPDSVREAVSKDMGNPIGEGYGLTETAPIATLNPSAFSKITGFMSKEKRGLGLPVPDTDFRVEDPATGEDVPFGETGEIVIRGPQVMKGYWPDASGLTEDGWFHTGDLGYMDNEGFFYVTDRIKDMINVSGLKVYSTKVDDVIFHHPGVQMVVTIGVPDPDREGSERVVAIVRAKEEFAGKIPEEEIINLCREKLAPYEVPRIVVFKDDLPMTVTGKLWKKELREEFKDILRKKE